MMFPIGRISEIQSSPEDFRLVERVPITQPNIQYPLQLAPTQGDEFPAAIIDLETTGLSHDDDKIIEFGAVLVDISQSTGQIIRIKQVMSLYEDPGFNIPPEITELTGISQDMVSGKEIDTYAVGNQLFDAKLFIAHNARFDRPFFDKRFPELNERCWACSLDQIDWKAKGFSSTKLELLLLIEGFFYQGHRASIDCLALAWLLHCRPDCATDLINNARSTVTRLYAYGAPFEIKDTLKKDGFLFDGELKVWWIDVVGNDPSSKIGYLDSLYRNARHQVRTKKINAFNRFKRDD